MSAKSLAVVSIAVAVSTFAVASTFEANCVQLFTDFKNKFKKEYNADEDSYRQATFCANMKAADEKNAINGKDAFGVTKFSDLTQEEFSVLLGYKKSDAPRKYKASVKKPKTMVKSAQDVASTNWLDAVPSVVTSVKNQGQCGSCWAFSAAEEIESQWAMNGNPIYEFSPQQIASCTTACNGCGGGDTVTAYEYLMSTVGLGSAWFAPYIQSMYVGCSTTKCTEACSSINVSALPSEALYTGPYAIIDGYSFATPECEGALNSCDSQDMTLLAQNLVEYGPVSVCVDASNWNSYAGGVLTQAACGGYNNRAIDHCVQLVGVNTTAAEPYWIVKNSWATNWGEDGYIYLQYPENTCGLANEATFVSISNDQAMFGN